MTLIAGIISRKIDQPVPAAVCEKLRQSITRNVEDQVRVFEDRRSFFVKADIGAFGDPAEKIDENGAITLLTGEPLLDTDSSKKWQSREKDTALIHESFVCSDLSILRSANGVFSAVHYLPSEGKLSLIADKLGLRPLYFWINDDYTVFASALRILEDLDLIPKKVDVQAVTEIVGLGYPLGERTPYADIRMVRAAEVVTVTDNEISHQKYWRWDEIKPSAASEEELLAELHYRFDNAVTRRIRNDTATAAYLSGGLDSRCIVASLRDKNIRVHTFNFARPHTQDQVFGLEFAQAMGTIHEEIPKSPGDLVPDYSSLMAEVWAAANSRSGASAERPAIVWSGEGGSVALGHVHLTEEMVSLMRAGEIDTVINEHLRRESAQVSPKMFSSKASDILSRAINDGLREELNLFHSHDPARNFYFHLLLNDQHRKLAKHFENIDLHRLEFQLPFFDSSFLELIASIPIDLCLRHRLYVKWLSLFPPPVTSVAWQVYPGHQPCPVPVTDRLAYQWADEYQSAERKTQKRRVLKQASELLSAVDFPGEILNKTNLRLAAWLHATGLRDYQYLIGPAWTYHSYWQKCGGRYVLPTILEDRP